MTREVLKLALEALDRVAPFVASADDNTDACAVYQAIAAIKAALAQPEQEPVAWISKHGVVYPLDAKDEVHPINELQPLYTSPPKRQPDDNGITVDLLEKLKATLTRLGYATPEGGLEAFGAYLPTQLYNLCRAADLLFEKALAQPEQVTHTVIAGALFDFMGYLTSRRERIVLSASDDAAPAVEAISDFAEKRGLSLDDAQVREWIDALAPPKRQPLTDGEIADLYFDNFSMGELTAFARAIEAKHGIGDKT